LFHRHDALKFGFERSRKTDLDITQFSLLFSAFCLVTYDDRKFKFDLDYAITSTARASKAANVYADPKGFVEDAKEAVCLFIEEGLEICFTHRMFQEYFAAKFIYGLPSEAQKKLIEKYSKPKSSRVSADRVIELLYELSPQTVEDFWLIPELSKLFLNIPLKSDLTINSWHAITKNMFGKITLHEHGITVGRESSFDTMTLISFVAKNCIQKERWTEMTGDSDEIESLDFSTVWRANETKEFLISEHRPQTRLIRDLSRVVAPHSRAGLNAVRTEFLAMLERSKQREDALESIIGF